METKSLIAAGRRLWDRVGDGVLAVGLFAASLMLYAQTLAPSVVALFDDSLEFPLVSYRLAIAHPTGYPLYTLLGKLFTLLPWHNVAWRVNLLSAVAGALTVALVYLVARQFARRLPALLGAVALAVSPVFWSQAVVAEVYTLTGAFIALLLWLALRWARRPLLPVEPFALLLGAPEKHPALFLPGEELWLRLPPAIRRGVARIRRAYRRRMPIVPPRRRLRLHPGIYALAALFGLSLTHHRMALLLAPALLAFVLLVEPRVLSRAALLGPEHPDRPRWMRHLGRPVTLLLLSFFAPFLLYLYLPLRGHVSSLDGTYTNTLGGLFRWVAGSSYNVFLGENPLARELNASFYIGLFWQQFGPVGLALMVLGVLGLLCHRRARGMGLRIQALALTGLAFLVFTAFGVLYRVPDVEVFFIPAFVVAAVWIGVGLDYAATLLQPRGPSQALHRLLAASGLALFLAASVQPLTIAAHNYPDLDLSQRWIVHDYGQYLLQEPLPEGSTVVGILGEMTLLRYFQDTTGVRADLETIAADDEALRREKVDAALADGRAVFITRPLAGLADAYALDAVTGLIDVGGHLEALIRVGQPSGEVPVLPQPIDQELSPGLHLLGYGVRQHGGHWQEWARLRLWWQAPQGLVEPFKVSARLVNVDGQVVAVTDAEPVSGAYPATVWRPGEVVADAYEIPLPAGLPPGEYVPLVIVYDPETGAERGRVELPAVFLEGNRTRPPSQALDASMAQMPCARFDGVELLGFTGPDPNAGYGPDNLLPLTLLWQGLAEPTGDLQVSFWLEGDGQYPLGGEPVGGRFPVSDWQEGSVVRQQPVLRISEIEEPGIYRLKMRVTRDGQPVPWGRRLIPLGNDLDLGVVRIDR